LTIAHKVILEREGAISEDRIETLLREAISAVAPSSPELRVEPRVETSADLSDNQQLTLGILDFSFRMGGEATATTLRTAQEILEHRGGSWRTNKNAAMLIAADAAALAKARASARSLGALRDLTNDRHRLSRFNAEQREQLAKRHTSAEERLPQQLTMAYRHLLLLGDASGKGMKLDQPDLGPARANATIPGRVLEHLRNADRLVEATLAPAALLAPRFLLLGEGTDVVELDELLGFFYQLPRLPKLASPQVLRQSLAEGVRQGLFGLASGSGWDAEDSVLRFAEFVDLSEIQFQPGTWLVRASVMKELIARRQPPQPAPDGEGEPGSGPVQSGADTEPSPASGTGGSGAPSPSPTGALPGVTLHVRGVPGSKARDVIKVAVLPLSAASPEVSVDLTIRAAGGMSGIPRETLDLVVLEGLRQLGLQDVQVEPHDES
jgi:hypothetical protein